MKHEPTRLEIFKPLFSFMARVYKISKSFYKGNNDAHFWIGGNGCLLRRKSDQRFNLSGHFERWLVPVAKPARLWEHHLLRSESSALPKESFDVAFCHFVLHDIEQDELERVIPELAKSIKPGGFFVFREPLNETKKLSAIKRLIEQNGLSLKDSRITDIPLMGNALESIYKK